MNWIKKILSLGLMWGIAFPCYGEINDSFSEEDEDFKKGISCIKADPPQYEEAVPFLTQAAEKGHGEAAYKLAKLYLKRNSFPPQLSPAEKKTKIHEWLRLASDKGHIKAPFILGFMYSFGDGVLQNMEKALEFLTLALERGSAHAPLLLGTIYLTGRGGILQDKEKALKLLTLASERGCAHASLSLGEIYLEGRNGILQNEKKALEFLTLASERGSAHASLFLGKIYLAGRGGILQDKEKALKLLTLASERGCAHASLFLGEIYLEGRDGILQNGEKALEFLTLAMERGAAPASFLLGEIYLEGREGVPQDKERGLSLLLHACDQGSQKAALLLGKLYCEGKKVLQDNEKAVRFLTMAVERESRVAPSELGGLAASLLGVIYEEGVGGSPPNKSEALAWYERAEKMGYHQISTRIKFLKEEIEKEHRERRRKLTWWQWITGS
jgi:hypothetical protein